MYVLGLETSCDETAAAIVEMPVDNGRAIGSGRILANRILSQIETHAPYGGVVPELAARAHLSHLDRLIAAALEEAALT
ncbi:MAG: tRNA (adenosine(37)-N6)-threonylcarbamoyltransferase complex transferase subunit TsaD, partial [Parvibaculales bacterium]